MGLLGPGKGFERSHLPDRDVGSGKRGPADHLSFDESLEPFFHPVLDGFGNGPARFIGDLENIRGQGIASPNAGREILNQSVAVEMGRKLGDHRFPESFIPERYCPRRLLFHAGVRIVFHVPGDAAKAVRKFFPERDIHPALARDRVLRFLNGH